MIKQEKNSKKVAFLTLGCKVNSYETNAMEALFLEAGYDIVEFSQNADIYIVNTCTVTNMADRKSRQMLHRAKKQNPNGIIVAVGCYVQAAKETIEQDAAIDVVIGNNKKNQIVKIVEKYQEDRSYHEVVADWKEEQAYESLHIETTGEKTRAYIKIQDGCNQFCSYCIIPYARGRVRSRNEEDIVKEVIHLVEQGCKEVVLTGIHLSSYGVNEENKDFVALEGKPLLSLINRISAIKGLERIRLGSLEPRIISESFVKALVEYNKVCPHFHLSLQSGCDETLKRMNRKYTTKEYYDKCLLLRKYYDRPAITTDIIVGFPGETEEEFLCTKAFLEKTAFAQMHIFKYSVRKGTKAEKMEAQVQEETKNQRSESLIKLEQALEAAYQNAFRGERQKILLEENISINGIDYQVGHTERYMKCAIAREQMEQEKLNEVVEALVEKSLNKDVMLCQYKQ